MTCTDVDMHKVVSGSNDRTVKVTCVHFDIFSQDQPLVKNIMIITFVHFCSSHSDNFFSVNIGLVLRKW